MINKKLLLFFLLFIIYLIVYNLGQLDMSINEPYYKYMENKTIREIYYFAMVLDSITIFMILIFLKKNTSTLLNRNARIIIVISTIVIIALIVFELYFGSTFYYGEVRDKQALPILINNFGFFGSTIYLCLIYFLIDFKKPMLLKKSKKLFFVYLLLILLLQILFFKIFESSWNMSAS